VNLDEGKHLIKPMRGVTMTYNPFAHNNAKFVGKIKDSTDQFISHNNDMKFTAYLVIAECDIEIAAQRGWSSVDVYCPREFHEKFEQTIRDAGFDIKKSNFSTNKFTINLEALNDSKDIPNENDEETNSEIIDIIRTLLDTNPNEYRGIAWSDSHELSRKMGKDN